MIGLDSSAARACTMWPWRWAQVGPGSCVLSAGTRETVSYCIQKSAQVRSDRQSAGSCGWPSLFVSGVLGVTQTRPNQFFPSARLPKPY